MKEFFTIMTRKGQITVPAEIRKTLHLKQGDRVGLSVRKTGKDKIQVTLRPVQSVAEMTFGSVTPRKRPEDFHELRQMFEEEMAEEEAAETNPAKKD